jgi:hypothetical protein
MSVLENVIKYITEDLLSKILPEAECTSRAHLINSEFAVRLIKTEFLAIRIDGAKKIEKLCKDIVKASASASEDSPIFASRLSVLKLIRENNLLEEFFSAKRIHQQLVMRSEGLILILLSAKELKEEDFEKIWTSVDQHAEFVMEFYKVLKSIASQMNT